MYFIIELLRNVHEVCLKLETRDNTYLLRKCFNNTCEVTIVWWPRNLIGKKAKKLKKNIF